MAVFFFMLMAMAYLAVGLAAREYTPRVRVLILGISTLIPTGILLSWQIA